MCRPGATDDDALVGHQLATGLGAAVHISMLAGSCAGYRNAATSPSNNLPLASKPQHLSASAPAQSGKAEAQPSDMHRAARGFLRHDRCINCSQLGPESNPVFRATRQSGRCIFDNLLQEPHLIPRRAHVMRKNTTATWSEASRCTVLGSRFGRAAAGTTGKPRGPGRARCMFHATRGRQCPPYCHDACRPKRPQLPRRLCARVPPQSNTP